jgi:hypothetical protein
VIVVGLSVLVGYLGSREDDRFDWELAAIFGTAAGTTLLAAATYWLAYSTRSEVRATQTLAELSRQDQAARERPVVVYKGGGFSGDPRNGIVRVLLLNIGLGPALRVRVSASYLGHPDWQPAIETVTIAAMPPNEDAVVDLHVRFPEPFLPGGVHDAFPISGSYLDLSQRNEYEIITSWGGEE